MKKNNKTVNQWMLELPESIRHQAIENMNKDYTPDGKHHVSKKKNNKIENALPEALEAAFYWHSSPEGYDFWNNEWNKLVDKENQKIRVN